MKKILKRISGYLPFILCFGVFTFIQEWNPVIFHNLLIQILLFIIVACIPGWITSRMSYVDVAWPWGLFFIGALLLFHNLSTRSIVFGSLYILMGLRMGVMSLFLFKPGLLKKDLPRYQYQRLRWKLEGYKNEKFSIVYEIMVQAFANISFLALPAFLQLRNQNESLSVLEWIGLGLWVISFGLEFLSDFQKSQFIKKARENKDNRAICNVGLWKYSRHPNYFFEWMVWNSLIIMSLPSLFVFYQNNHLVIFLFLSFALFYISRIMYNTLVDYTGARPSEYYSVKKRPEYKQYQKTTNMFFPGPPKV